MAVIHTNYFLFIVGIFTLYVLPSSKQYLKIKSSVNVKNTDRILTIIMFLFGLAFIIFGILKLFLNNNSGVVLLIFGIISFDFVTQDYSNFTKTNLPENIYLQIHISRMFVAYIASVTAFLVTNNHFCQLLLRGCCQQLC